jgi:hypothetical protein
MISLCCARKERALPTMPIRVLPKFFINGASTFISGAIATFADDHYHIIGLYHSEVAMNGIGCVHK